MSQVNKVGIVYSPGYGAGWSTWGDSYQALDQELAYAIEAGKPLSELEAIAKKNWPDAYLGGLKRCIVEWVDSGTLFAVEEYDGSESLRFSDNFMVAVP